MHPSSLHPRFSSSAFDPSRAIARQATSKDLRVPNVTPTPSIEHERGSTSAVVFIAHRCAKIVSTTIDLTDEKSGALRRNG